MKILKQILFAATLSVATTAAADDFRPAMESYLETQIRSWIATPVLVQAIKAQNARTATLDQGQIDQMDADWRADVKKRSSPMVVNVLENEAAQFLRQKKNNSEGIISEVFLMDARGLNVAASDPTSDYWQGDEAKFQQTYPLGSNAVHVGDVEFDESSQSFQGQISVVIVDPANNRPIGAMTVGLNAETLF